MKQGEEVVKDDTSDSSREESGENQPVIFVNVTDPDGVLLGRFPVASDDLRYPDWIGRQVIEELPASLCPETN